MNKYFNNLFLQIVLFFLCSFSIFASSVLRGITLFGDINPPIPVTDGLVRAYRFDKSQNGGMTDESDYVSNGWIVNNGFITDYNWMDNFASGELGNASTGNYMRFNFPWTYPADGGTYEGPFSVSVWVKPTYSSQRKGIFGFGRVAHVQSNVTLITRYGYAQLLNYSANIGGSGDPNAQLNLGVWNHIVIVHNFTYSSATRFARMYINGSLAATANSNDSFAGVNLFHSASFYGVGRSGFTSNHYSFTDPLDNFLLYDRILTDEEIATLYLAGN